MANNNVDVYTQNMMARQMLLQSGISMVKRLQPITGALGSQVKIPLLRMGIMTGVLLQFTVPVVIASAPAVPSPVAPWNIANVVSYQDFAGVQRTRTHGFQLWAAQSMKNGDAMSAIPAMNYGGGEGPSLNSITNVLNVPAAVGSANITFSLYVPMAYNPDNDLTGAVLTQTNVGEHFINVQLANALVNADPWIAPYISGAVTSGGNVTIEAFQYYIQPQAMDAQNLPVIDLSTVYGFEGAIQNTANITTGQSVYVNYPNNRSVLSALFNYENASVFTANGADVNGIILMANSNTNFRELSPRLVKETMRNMCNSDLPGGSYFLSSRRQPIMTQLYANVQARFDLGTVNSGGVTQIVSQYEVQYASGAPLPGITVAA
jgi:hypothetical protein